MLTTSSHPTMKEWWPSRALDCDSLKASTENPIAKIWSIRSATKGRRKQGCDEDRNVPRDLPQDKPNPKSIPTNQYRHHDYMESGVYDGKSIESLTHNQLFCRRVPNCDEIPLFDGDFLK